MPAEPVRGEARWAPSRASRVLTPPGDPIDPEHALDWSVTDRTGLRSEPTRTCVGCRATDSRSALLRVVAETSRENPRPGGGVTLVPDPRHRMPGRGAWVHPRAVCLELAVRRKAFGRALRLQAAVDLTAVTGHIDTKHVSSKHDGTTHDGNTHVSNQDAQQHHARHATSTIHENEPQGGSNAMSTR
ncbi:YlxR family protein [Terracoccus luteus]|uniref:YlxR family protein n=1 Tax=Terracoccus luteus TaxID=53356 RepID=UPI000EB1ED8D|nr:YlxR family protein [Terracoccus luteus]